MKPLSLIICVALIGKVSAVAAYLITPYTSNAIGALLCAIIIVILLKFLDQIDREMKDNAKLRKLIDD